MDSRSKLKDIIYIAIGLSLAVIIGVFLNNSTIAWEIGSLISWILAITMMIVFFGIVVCSFLLAKPLSNKIEL